MQQEAEKRVREMQERSRLFSGSDAKPEPTPILPRKNEHFVRSECHPSASFSQNANKNLSQNQNFGFPDPLSSIGNDRLIILGLLWLLWNEHADSKLLLALVYLLL